MHICYLLSYFIFYAQWQSINNIKLKLKSLEPYKGKEELLAEWLITEYQGTAQGTVSELMLNSDWPIIRLGPTPMSRRPLIYSWIISIGCKQVNRLQKAYEFWAGKSEVHNLCYYFHQDGNLKNNSRDHRDQWERKQ